jgi:putative acyl-CoA dehydrogenase
LQRELAPALGQHAALDRVIERLPVMLQELARPELARRMAQELALLMQAALLVQSAPAAVWQAFCDSRLAGHWGQAFGTLGPQADLDAIIARAMP